METCTHSPRRFWSKQARTRVVLELDAEFIGDVDGIVETGTSTACTGRCIGSGFERHIAITSGEAGDIC
jgi:hypothetical protein